MSSGEVKGSVAGLRTNAHDPLPTSVAVKLKITVKFSHVVGSILPTAINSAISCHKNLNSINVSKTELFEIIL